MLAPVATPPVVALGGIARRSGAPPAPTRPVLTRARGLRRQGRQRPPNAADYSTLIAPRSIVMAPDDPSITPPVSTAASATAAVSIFLLLFVFFISGLLAPRNASPVGLCCTSVAGPSRNLLSVTLCGDFHKTLDDSTSDRLRTVIVRFACWIAGSVRLPRRGMLEGKAASRGQKARRPSGARGYALRCAAYHPILSER